MERLTRYGLIVALFVTALAFGGTEPLVLYAVQILLFVLAILFLLTHKARESAPTVLPVVVPLCLLALVVLQVIPLPAAVVELFRNPSFAPPQPGSLTLSVDPYLTISQLLLLLTYLVAFYLTLTLSRRREVARSLVLALLVLGGVEAFYGLVQFLTGWQRIFIYPKVFSVEDATGTYINRNHFAGLLALVLPFALALVYYYFVALRAIFQDDPARGHHGSVHAAPQKLLFWLSLTVVLFIAVVFSRSRMGILTTVVAVLAMIILVGSSARRGKAWVAVGLFFLFLGAVLALWIGLEPVLFRFEQLDQELALSSQNRLAIWKDTLQLIRENPWFGTGLGTFPVAYTSTQTAFLSKFVNHAHNDYLELASDLGLPGALLFFAGVYTLLVRTISRFRAGEEDIRQAIALGCTGSMVAMLLFSLTDFNLYIPANALVFSVVLGLAYSTSTDSKRVESA